MRNIFLMLITSGIVAVLFADSCRAQVGGTGGPAAPTVPHINWSGIEAYVNNAKTGKTYNAVNKGVNAAVKSSFDIINPTDSPTTYDYKTYVNGKLHSSINTTTLGANTSVTIPQAFSSNNLQSDYTVSIKVTIGGAGSVNRIWTFKVNDTTTPSPQL